jgi:hypothetical protein
LKHTTKVRAHARRTKAGFVPVRSHEREVRVQVGRYLYKLTPTKELMTPDTILQMLQKYDVRLLYNEKEHKWKT